MASTTKDESAPNTEAAAPSAAEPATPTSAFAPGDFVTYSGSLGEHRGRVVSVDGPRHTVALDGVGAVLCGAADLTAEGDGLPTADSA